MKTSEAWEMLADTIEDWGMPFSKYGDRCLGLCECIGAMVSDGFIGLDQEFIMLHQLRVLFGRRKLFYWTTGAVKPRIKACRILAELSV